MKKIIRYWLMLCAVTDKMYDNFFTIGLPVGLMYFSLSENVLTVVLIFLANGIISRDVFLLMTFLVAIMFVVLSILTDKEISLKREYYLSLCKNYRLCKFIVIFYAIFSWLLLTILPLIFLLKK